MKALWVRYRTIGGAIIATVVLGGMVYAGHLTSTRALVPLVFAWMFGLHSLDYREATEEHAKTVLEALARAGMEERAGQRAEALQDVGAAMHEAADCVEDIAAQKAGKAGAA